ncbi:3,4-dihydroxy-2-butanone-4-phosphate synthase [Puniceicoccales bacterium CK1056]|uniref:3,4-dihydroxy-2-butanone 4-phosphate synthase n=1 Tax=Oceanipulchritudo coccoides TaxID=2706888 RepID=A0A6B2M0E1_9BACT|nr:3,4-dihydroxy-2-butanone-4-phosphate synthase [Oceanipulchritudo coccoides]NDV62378.1 3,4-dihydroxy-2-butanone-4-phosphate synthase [Oceanipulchritudo coccoides]
MPEDTFDSVEAAIDDIAAGKLVIVVDDEDRENEGDLIMAAAKATPETVNMMIRHGRGLICVPTIEHQLKRLGLNPMVANNRESHRTDFTVSVDAAEGVTTGISAADRCEAIQIIANPDSTADQLVQPGHVFPLRARPGGVLQRAGHTEAAVDLAVLAGLPPAGVLCEILNEDGTMARLKELIEYRKTFGLKLISIKQLIEYRHSREKLIDRILSQPFQNAYGDWTLHLFRSLTDHRIHFALTMGELGEGPTLVRVQSENILSDVFSGNLEGSERAVDLALRQIAKAGRGAFVYMTHSCAGLNIPQGSGGDPDSCALEPVSMDFRGYGLGAQILYTLGLREIRLLSSSQRKHVALDGYGLHIDSFEPLDGETV